MWALQDAPHMEINLLVCRAFEESTTYLYFLLVVAAVAGQKLNSALQICFAKRSVLFTPLLALSTFASAACT